MSAAIETRAWVRRDLGQIVLGLGSVWVALAPLSVCASDLLWKHPTLTDREAAEQWTRLVHTARGLPTGLRVSKVNEIINRRIRYDSDQAVWGRSDFWATPLQTFAQGRGDCEDFAIAKYFSLLESGIPDARLRLVVGRIRHGGRYGSLTEAHMVLAYIPSDGAEPLVLDNLVDVVRPLSRRPDLVPVFSFNRESIWLGLGKQGVPRTGADRLTVWQTLLARNVAGTAGLSD